MRSCSGVSWPYSACLKSSMMCVFWGRGCSGRKLYVILGWDSGNCFNEMECSLFRTCLAETAMFCPVSLLGRAGHTFPAVLNGRTLGEPEQGGWKPPRRASSLAQGSSGCLILLWTLLYLSDEPWRFRLLTATGKPC